MRLKKQHWHNFRHIDAELAPHNQILFDRGRQSEILFTLAFEVSQFCDDF